MSSSLSRLWQKVNTTGHRAAAVVGASALAMSFAPAASVSASQALPQAAAAQPAAPSRSLSFYNLHTEERVTVTYWAGGYYNHAALEQIGRVLRDHRRDEVQTISTDLIEYLYTIQEELRPQYPNNPMVFEVISGYRARETTDNLRRGGAAVASDTSQHQLGTAMDFRIDGIPLRTLRDTAWCLQRGGVGYYPESHNNFIHVDVGRVRFWPASRQAWACMS